MFCNYTYNLPEYPYNIGEQEKRLGMCLWLIILTSGKLTNMISQIINLSLNRLNLNLIAFNHFLIANNNTQLCMYKSHVLNFYNY